MNKRRIPVRLALQGGGALGAFSAGVLDALLSSPRIELTHFSGTSAGAINAVICASALATGGRRAARLALSSFWESLASSSIDDYMGMLLGPFGQSVGKDFGEWLWSSAKAMPGIYGGSVLPHMHSTPLRAVLDEHIDLEALRAPGAPQVFVTLTNVRTGLPRVVGNADLTLDTILASACLPDLFRAVEFNDDAFWDGGFTGNPTLWPLIRQPGPSDILLVQLSPNMTQKLPSSPAEVRQRITEIVFNSSLVAEMQAIQAIRDLTGYGPAAAGAMAATAEENSFSRARFHRVGPPPGDLLSTGASVDRSARNLQALWQAGRDDARRFLMREGRKVGLKETLDLKTAFIDEFKTRLAGPATPAATTPTAQRVRSQALGRRRRVASTDALSASTP
jgi:NTE family protein